MTESSPASRGSKRANSSALPSEIPPGTAESHQRLGTAALGGSDANGGGYSSSNALHEQSLVYLETCTTLDQTASFHNPKFVLALLETFQAAVIQRGTRLASHSLGHAPSPLFCLDVLLGEDDSAALWSAADHSDHMGLVRSAIAKSFSLSVTDSEMDLGHGAVVDCFVDALRLAVQRSFTALQTQRWLLLVKQTYDDVRALPNVDTEGGESILEGPVARKLTKRLTTLTTRVTLPCVTSKTILVTEKVEKPDAAAVAAIEAKRDAAKGNKKTLAQLDEQLKNVPLITVEVQSPRVVEEQTSVDIPPSFAPDDAVALCAFLSESLFQHWRLFWTASRLPRAVETSEFDAPIWDLPMPVLCPVTHAHYVPIAPPPLSTALPQQEYLKKCERDRLCDDAEQTIRHSFELLFDEPVKTLLSCLKVVVETEQRERDAAERADRQAAMTSNEFEDAVRVLSHRVTKRSHKNPNVTGPASILVPAPPPPPAEGIPANRPTSATAKGVPVPPGKSAPPAAAAAPQRLNSIISFAPGALGGEQDPSSAADPVGFSVADVELRLQRISDVLTNGMATGSSRPGTSTSAAPAKKK